MNFSVSLLPARPAGVYWAPAEAARDISKPWTAILTVREHSKHSAG
jgi:hypothetical protein